MARKPTEQEIQVEMSKIGGGNDFFAARDRLQHRFAEAERAVEKLKPVAVKNDDAPWSVEPTADQILAEAKNFGFTPEDARESLKRKLAADAKRLASFSAMAAAEISEALEQAEAAREKAANILMEHEAALSAVSTGILAVGNIRRKIAVVKSLFITEADKKRIANAALDYFVSLKTGFESVEKQSGFRVFAEDLAFRNALTPHIAAFVKPFEDQASGLIVKIKAQADAAGMDLQKVFQLLKLECGQRGDESLLTGDFYAGLN